MTIDCNFKNKDVKTKKDHRCEGCNIVYSAGSIMRYIVQVFEGDFHNYYLCQNCNNCDWEDELEEGFDRGEILQFWGTLKKDYNAGKCFWRNAE